MFRPQLVEEVGLSNEVLLLSYNFLDRYLSRVSVKKDMLQLVSVACVWLARHPTSFVRCFPVYLYSLERASGQ